VVIFSHKVALQKFTTQCLVAHHHNHNTLHNAKFWNFYSKHTNQKQPKLSSNYHQHCQYFKPIELKKKTLYASYCRLQLATCKTFTSYPNSKNWNEEGEFNNLKGQSWRVQTQDYVELKNLCNVHYEFRM
jgi:hypothetical protein